MKQYDKAKKECAKALKQSPDDKACKKLQVVWWSLYPCTCTMTLRFLTNYQSIYKSRLVCISNERRMAC